LRGLTGWGTQGEANEADSTPIMTQQHLPDDNARAPIDRSRAGRGGGSIGLVLLIAFVLVAAAGALLLIGRAKAEPFIVGLLAVLAASFCCLRSRPGFCACRVAKPRTRCSRPWSIMPTKARW
jgi:hypothetical protein